ncbi:hypothetical protein K435DRAFT_598110, partial [Dendrothele bispora CBS 962.96]
AVDPERLKMFEKDPVTNGPKRRNTRFDKRGATPTAIMESSWNQAVILMLANEAHFIFTNCRDGRFGRKELDWKRLFHDRLMVVARDVIASLPQRPDEPLTERLI